MLPTVSGKKDENGNFFLDKNHLHYFQVQSSMAISGLKTCHFVTNTSKGIFIVTINFNDKFWETVVATVYSSIFPDGSLTSWQFSHKKVIPKGVDQQIQ